MSHIALIDGAAHTPWRGPKLHVAKTIIKHRVRQPGSDWTKIKPLKNLRKFKNSKSDVAKTIVKHKVGYSPVPDRVR